MNWLESVTYDPIGDSTREGKDKAFWERQKRSQSFGTWEPKEIQGKPMSQEERLKRLEWIREINRRMYGLE